MERGLGHFNAAAKKTINLRDRLIAEVENARKSTLLLRSLDVENIVSHAATREVFNREIMVLQKDIMGDLRQASFFLSVDCTAEDLERALPGHKVKLSDLLSEIGALASALNELDQLNAYLGERALALVQGYLNALLPGSEVYDRRALAFSAGNSISTTSSRV